MARAMMRVSIRSRLTVGQTDGPTELLTNAEATVDSLISGYCSRKGMAHEMTHGLFTQSGRLLPKRKTLRSAGVRDGDVLSLGYAPVTLDTSKMTAFFSIAIVGMIVSAAGLIAVIVLYTTTGGGIPFEYGIVMDAGSSHTDVTVYNWEGDKYEGTGIVHQVDVSTTRVGISSYYPNFEEAGTSLIPYVKAAVSHIPKDKLSSSPLFLGATAGMRLLEISDPFIARALLFSVKCALVSQGLNVQKVEVISGQDEGMFAWVTTNFLLRTLQEAAASGDVGTWGAMDMGGASMQIAFASNATTSSDDITPLKLYGVEHYVYSKTYLCYGINEAWRRYLALLAYQKLEPEVEIEDPCAPKDYKFKKTVEYLFNATCTIDLLPKEKWEKRQNNVTFVGTGNEAKCLENVRIMLKPEECHNRFHGNCFEKPPSVPVADQKFLAMSTFQFMASFLNASNDTADRYREQMQAICAMSAAEILTIPKTEDKYVPIYCFEANYVFDILQEYGFDDGTWPNLQFRKKIGGANIGWSLGYMINATNAIPEEGVTPPVIRKTPFVLLVILCSFVLLLSVGAAIYYYRKKKNIKDYEEMSGNVTT